MLIDCDYFWNIHSGLQCALFCGWCFNREECGLSYMNFNTSPEYARWDVGACIVMTLELLQYLHTRCVVDGLLILSVMVYSE